MTPASPLFIVKSDTPGAEVRREGPEQELRQAVTVFREILAGLVKDCDTGLAEGQGLRDVAGRLVAAVTAGTEVATQHARTALQTRVVELEREIERLHGELQAERGRTAEAADALGLETAGRVRAEAALQEARDVSQQIVVRYEAQVHAAKATLDAARTEIVTLRQQLEAEQAERSRLASALVAVQQAMTAFQPSGGAPAAALPAQQPPPPAQTAQAPRPLPVPAQKTGPPAPVSDGPAVDPEQLEYVQHLLDEAEVMYKADLESGRTPIDVVDRLTANLRYARESITRRFPEPEGAAATLFQSQLTALLDAKGETAFGRHLSIAAHACIQERSGTGAESPRV